MNNRVKSAIRGRKLWAKKLQHMDEEIIPHVFLDHYKGFDLVATTNTYGYEGDYIFQTRRKIDHAYFLVEVSIEISISHEEVMIRFFPESPTFGFLSIRESNRVVFSNIEGGLEFVSMILDSSELYKIDSNGFLIE